jgi:hypothetical protein
MVVAQSLHRMTGAKTGCPGPLEVEAAKLAGNVDHFPDKEKAGHFLCFHGFCGKFAGIDSASGDFRFSVTFRRLRV